jgi:hypothetical protein
MGSRRSDDGDYFEGQRSRDCVIHSLNNAFGRHVIDKSEVLRYIDEKVASEMAHLERDDPNAIASDVARLEKRMRARYSTGKTFFTADIVWECARTKGVYRVHAPIPGFVTPFLRIDTMLSPEVVVHPIVMLGGDANGDTHAVAVRGGSIYDSERIDEGPRPMTRSEVETSLPKVFGAYAFLQDPRDATRIRRSAGVVRSFDDDDSHRDHR